MTDVEVVKKGYLKDRLHSQSNSSKSLWFVFRIGSSASGRILDIYNSEKESTKKNAIAKDRIYLREIQSVTTAGNGDRKVFYLSCVDGSVQNCLEAPSESECCEWVFALNAVLFGKGSNGRNLIQFAVNIHKCSQYNYYGNGILEVRDDSLILWSQGETIEVLRWKLGHLRSFKAKSGVLEIIAGSRSSTGEGVFTFGTQESVLITHTLETVIDRLARLKRAKTTKLQQALPPIPQSQPPTTLMPSMTVDDSKPLAQIVNSPSNSGSTTLVRGRTNTKQLIPEFSDIPDTSLRFSTTGYDRSMRHSGTSVPDVRQTYDKLCTSKSISSGDLMQTNPDIYTSQVDDINTLRKSTQLSTRLSLQGNDYSYVDTEPKCVLLSPTGEKSVGLGEVRHSSSMKEQIVTSDYSEADDYSSLKPVDVVGEILPKGLYNQLDFSKGLEDEINDMVVSDIPPPLPPPPIMSPPIAPEEYENIGTHSLPRIQGTSQNAALTDSAGSMEFCLEGSHSPKFTKKSKVPSVSPRQSPRTSPRLTMKLYHESIDNFNISRSSAPYDKVTRIPIKPTTSKQFEIGEESGTYSTLAAKKQDTSDTIISDSTNQYSMLSHNLVSKQIGENNYNQLLSGQTTTKNHAEEKSGGNSMYSTISRPNDITGQSLVGTDTVNQPDSDTYMDNAYSTLQVKFGPPFESPNSLQKSIDPSTKHYNVEYEEVEHIEAAAINSHAYDQVDFNETENKELNISIYEDSFVDEHSKEIVQNQKPFTELTSINVPPIPPRRGASIKNQGSNTVRKPPPPPVKPKPHSSKQYKEHCENY